MKLHIHSSIPDIPMYFWAIVTKNGPGIGGFPSEEAARVFAEEWDSDDCCIVPIVPIEEATNALATYERMTQNLGPA